MIRILWPTKRKPEPTTLGRLGRVLHWSVTLFAVLLLILAALNLNSAAQLETSTGLFLLDGSPSPETPQEAAQWHWKQGTKWLLYGVGALVAARATRYVLSAE